MRHRVKAAMASAVAVAGVAVGQLAVGAASPASASSGGSPVVEGVISAFSGPSAFEGPVNMAGALPAMYEIDQAGGILGHPLQVTTVDTRGDPADALPLIQRMIASHSNLVGLTGPSGNTGPALVPIINRERITMFSLAGESSFDRNTDQYFWRLLPPDPAQGIAMAIWAKERGYTRVAAVFGTDSSAQGDLPGVLQGAKDLHLKIVANVSLTPDQVSYKSDVAKLLAAHPQAILTEEDAPTAATFFSDVSQIGTVIPIIGDGADTTPNWVQGVSAALGVKTFAKKFTVVNIQSPKTTPANTAMNTGINHEGSKLNKPLSQWYNEPYAEAAYDGVVVQALAMQAAHSLVPSKYNSYIPAVTEPGKGKTVVYTFAAGKAALAHGKKIEYVGASGPIKLNKWHNSYGNQVAIVYPKGTLASAKTVQVITAAQIESAG